MCRARVLALSIVCLVLPLLATAAAQDPDALKRAKDLDAEALEHRRLWTFADGIPKGREALAIRERILGPDHPEVAASLDTLAWLLLENGDYAEARPLFERALQIRERALSRNSRAVASTLNGLGYLLFLSGDYAQAQPFLERARQILERNPGPNHPAVAVSLNNLGLVLHHGVGDYAAAKSLHERALQIREQALGPNHVLVAQSLNNLGELLQDLGNYPAARPLFERALQIREQSLGPNHPAVATSLRSLGRLHQVTGDFASARSALERALEIREQALGPNHPQVAIALNNLALLHHATSNYGAARRLNERALQIREKTLGPNHPQVAQSLNNLGEVLRDVGSHAAARPLFERALQIREQTLGPRHPAVAMSLHSLGNLLLRTGDSRGARPLFERALQIREQTLGPSHPLVAVSLNGLAFLHSTTRNYAAARPLRERALQIREQTLGSSHPAVGWSLNGLGWVLWNSGDSSGAKSVFERALQIAKKAAIPDLLWRPSLGLGRVFEREGRLMEALAFYREGMHALEGQAGQFGEEGSRTQYLQAENRPAVYEALARLLLKLHEQDGAKGYDREAWAVLEARKGRMVAEALGAARPKLQDPKTREEAEKTLAKQDRVLALELAIHEEQVKPPKEQHAEKIQNLTALLAQTKAEYLAQVQGFLKRYPQYKSQFVDQQTVDPKLLAKFAERLAPGTLVIQYFASPDALYLFVVGPGGRFQVKRRAVSQSELYGMIKEYRRYLEQAATHRLPWTDDGSEAYRRDVLPLKELDRKLAGHLLEPIAAELEANRSLILIPNDLLLYLPIHALTRVQPDGSVRVLAETHAVSILTQLELVDILAPAQQAANPPLLALANPDGSLPGASREIRALLPIRPGVTSLEGSQATKIQFLKLVTQFPDLHLATHGVLDAERPEQSYLLMAGTDELEQRLGIDEIAGLNLRSGLAILSACETAVGEQVPGAALTTLAAAFSQAGAQSIVASLWKVNDAATRDFMVAFHRALPAAGRAAAFQKAQLAVMKNPPTAHPYYWAPFILIGAR